MGNRRGQSAIWYGIGRSTRHWTTRFPCARWSGHSGPLLRQQERRSIFSWLLHRQESTQDLSGFFMAQPTAALSVSTPIVELGTPSGAPLPATTPSFSRDSVLATAEAQFGSPGLLQASLVTAGERHEAIRETLPLPLSPLSAQTSVGNQDAGMAFWVSTPSTTVLFTQDHPYGPARWASGSSQYTATCGRRGGIPGHQPDVSTIPCRRSACCSMGGAGRCAACGSGPRASTDYPPGRGSHYE